MSFVDAEGLKRAFTKLKSLIDKKWNMVGTGDIIGMASPSGDSDIYVKAPMRGILPYSDKASNTSNKTYYLGTPAWPWSIVYADSFVGNLNGNSTTANTAIHATSADSVPSLTSDDINDVFTEVFG